MTEKKADCMILGLLSHEELTGYEIKHRIDASLNYFWGASFGSIYPTLNGLVEQGLAEKRNDPESPRNRQVYSITEAGREYLRRWLSEPVQRDEIRYETLLKLFFGNEAGPEQTARHIRAFQEKCRANLASLQAAKAALEAADPDDRTHLYYLLTVKFGLQTYTGYLSFCDEALTELEKISR